MNLFGLALFEKKQSAKLYDFAQHGILRMEPDYGMDYAVEVYDNVLGNSAKPKKPAKKKPEAPKKTPKEIYQLKTLNTPEFEINTDKTYLAKEIAMLEKKLALYPIPPKKAKKGIEQHFLGEHGAVHYGREEVKSMIERLGNRSKLPLVAAGFNKYPHTTNDAIRQVLSDNKHLEARLVDAMLPDLPSDAIDAINDYTNMVKQVCGKRPVFYLIAERVEQKSVNRKRDPILLAQSPFGFFWQILGAWDKEVVLLDEL